MQRTTKFMGVFLAAVSAFGQSATIESSGNLTPSGTVSSTTGLSSSGAFAVAQGICMYWNRQGQWTQSFCPAGVGGQPSPKHRHWRLPEIKSGARPVGLAQLAPASYLVHAQKIHLESAATDDAELLSVLHDLGVKIYDRESVSMYLYDKAHEKGANVEWVWKPMREADQSKVGSSDIRGDAFGGFLSNILYASAIPERVVDLAAMVLEHVPAAEFLISDYEVKRPDPFMAVTTPKLAAAGKYYIIACWDEPMYKEPDAPEAPVMQFGPHPASKGATD